MWISGLLGVLLLMSASTRLVVDYHRPRSRHVADSLSSTRLL
jgi:hypothetical protein